MAKSRKIKLIPGDILAVPRDEGDYFFLIYILDNRFGYAFGLFRDTAPMILDLINWLPEPLPYPIYSDDGHVKERIWKRVGNRADLLTMFSPDPPIYHRKSNNRENDKVGPYGSAETADCTLRNLTDLEAIDIELNKSFRTIQICAQVEMHLEELLERRAESVSVRSTETDTS